MMFRISSLRSAGVGSMLSSIILSSRRRSENSQSYINMSTETETIKNPLLSKTKLPLFSEIAPKDVNPAIEFNLEKIDDNFLKFEKKVNVIIMIIIVHF